jgi:integrase
MANKRKTDNSSPDAAKAAPITLADLLISVEQARSLSATKRRDLSSAVKRVASLLGEEPANIPLDLAVISAKLTSVNPIAVGISAKTFANLRSGLLTAVKLSGLKPVQRSARTPLDPAWAGLMAQLSGRRAHLGLSRLARHASANGIGPEQINDAAIDGFIAAVRAGSLQRKPNDLHRRVTQIWNEAAKLPDLHLQMVMVPSFRPAAKRVDWQFLPFAFQKDVEEHLVWCGGADVFAEDARPRALAPRTLKLRRNQFHAAVTALLESGIKPSSITSLADLVSPENFKRILRGRLEAAGGRENAFNRDLAEALVQIGREWVELEPSVLTELKRLAGKMPMPAAGLTPKNKASLRQFDDRANLQRLIDLPNRLWAEVKREANPNFRTLAKAQAALGVAILSYMPLRPENLTSLTFGIHLFMGEGLRATSSLEVPSGEMKNETEMAFDIPLQVAKMLVEYRDRIAPKVIGHRPERVFVNADGSPKSQATVAWLIKTYLKRRAGILLTPHQFRHLSAKVTLDAEPGSFETVRQFLGHKNYKTTTNFYAGIDTRRAARHHQRLIERTLEAQKPTVRRKMRTPRSRSDKAQKPTVRRKARAPQSRFDKRGMGR